MKRLAIAGLLALLTVVPAPATHAGGPTNPETDGFDVLGVGGNVYMLRTRSGVTNTSVGVFAGADGVLLVDANFPNMGPAIESVLDSLDTGEVRYLVNTHFHWDHAWGNEYFGKEADVIAHGFVREMLLEKELPDGSGRTVLPEGIPGTTVRGSMTIHMNGEEVLVAALAKPGHTGGDVIVHFRNAGVLCVGDYYFAGGYPIIDVENGGSFEGYFENLAWILEVFDDGTRVIPGHGRFNPEPVRDWTIADMRAWYDGLLQTVVIIRTQKAAGQTLEGMQNEGLPDRFSAWNQKPRFVSEEKWIAFVWGQVP